MNFAIFADSHSWYFRDLQRAAESLGHTTVRLDFAQLTGVVRADGDRYFAETQELRDIDHVIVRSMPPGSLEQIVVRMDLLARWEARGVPVSNPPKALECAIDKYLTTSRLAAAGLPVPETVVCQTADEALYWWEQLGRDVVVKPLFGAEGRGIIRVTDADLAWRAFTTIARLQAVLYLQRFIDHGGCDFRVLVLGEQALGGMCRRSAHDFRTNVARQGVATPHTPNALETEFALRAANAVGTHFAGIDMLYDRDGQPYVIEVNAVPGWSAFARVNQVDVAATYLQFLAQHSGAA